MKPGHSMTIVGIEKLKTGEINLLVFDPMFQDAYSITKLIGRTFEHRFPEMALKSYRRGNSYLRKYKEFEVLRYVCPQSKTSLLIAERSLSNVTNRADTGSNLRQIPYPLTRKGFPDDLDF